MITEIESITNVTIPDEIVKKLDIKPGDYLDAKLLDDGILLTPVVFVPRSQTEMPQEQSWDEVHTEEYESREYAAADFKLTIMAIVKEALDNGLTKEQLAELSGVTVGVINKIEADVGRVKTSNIQKIMSALGKMLTVSVRKKIITVKLADAEKHFYKVFDAALTGTVFIELEDGNKVAMISKDEYDRKHYLIDILDRDITAPTKENTSDTEHVTDESDNTNVKI
jgi:transcriptional regulator with XRE-family HTH domain/antitoxin component of MazEF toxin-antitoxin module